MFTVINIIEVQTLGQYINLVVSLLLFIIRDIDRVAKYMFDHNLYMYIHSSPLHCFCKQFIKILYNLLQVRGWIQPYAFHCS